MFPRQTAVPFLPRWGGIGRYACVGMGKYVYGRGSFAERSSMA